MFGGEVATRCGVVPAVIGECGKYKVDPVAWETCRWKPSGTRTEPDREKTLRAVVTAAVLLRRLDPTAVDRAIPLAVKLSGKQATDNCQCLRLRHPRKG